jgi:hypothetical protein
MSEPGKEAMEKARGIAERQFIEAPTESEQNFVDSIVPEIALEFTNYQKRIEELEKERDVAIRVSAAAVERSDKATGTLSRAKLMEQHIREENEKQFSNLLTMLENIVKTNERAELLCAEFDEAFEQSAASDTQNDPSTCLALSSLQSIRDTAIQNANKAILSAISHLAKGVKE